MKLKYSERLKNIRTVDISDARISTDPTQTLATYSLGSCIGVCLYSQKNHTGAMLHCLLPDSTANLQRAQENPFVYADTGMKLLLEKLMSMGIRKNDLTVKVAGGAQRLKVAAKGFDTGKRNYLAIRKILWKNGIFINAEDVGGYSPRTMYMNIADGTVTLSTHGVEKNL